VDDVRPPSGEKAPERLDRRPEHVGFAGEEIEPDMGDAGPAQTLPLRRPVAAAPRAAGRDHRHLGAGRPLRFRQADQRAAGAAPQERGHMDDAPRPAARGIRVRHARIVACGKHFGDRCGTQTKAWLDGLSIARFPVPGLHNLVQRVPPVVAAAKPEAAVYVVNWLSATGTGIFIAAIIAGFTMGRSVAELAHTYARTLRTVSTSLLTISAMMSIGYLTRYSGIDATLGLAFAGTGMLYPFFGTMLGWLGVALTGSDTSSNVLFGSLQRITAEQLGLSPVLMAAANSSGGVMGKMIDAQSIVVASTATRWFGHEGEILRFVFWHSVVLAALVGLVVTLQAYVYPFTAMVVSN